MNAIRMVVIPLIVTVIFSSIARLGDPRKLGRIGGMTIAFYWISLIPAIAIGMATMKFGLRFASEIEMPQTQATTVPELQSIVDFFSFAGPCESDCGSEQRGYSAADRFYSAGCGCDRDAAGRASRAPDQPC